MTGPNSTVYRFDGSGVPAAYTAGSNAGTNILTGADGPSGGFGEVKALAVDNTGNLYVVDTGHGLVDKFAPSGAFLTSFNGAEAPEPFATITGVAIDPTNEDLLVVDSGHNVVDEFESSGEYLTG